MTSDPLDQATRLLRDAVNDAGDVDVMPPDRDVAVARIADALRARAQARRRKQLVGRFAVAAGVLAVAGAGAFAASRAGRSAAPGDALRGHDSPSGHDLGRVDVPAEGVTALRQGRPESLGAGARVAEGTELRTTASSEAHLDFDSGTRITLGGAARVRLVEQSQRKRFALESGSFSAHVAKLTADERFVVTTPDAEVEVRGTAFRVTIVPSDAGCAGGSPTRLVVSEGVVVVRHAGAEVRVSAGEHWPSCDAPEAHGAAIATPAASALATARPASTIAVSSQPGGAAAEASSRLAEQNDLFDEAMRLKRGGDGAAAVAKLDRLLTAYPGGPLSESAEVERMRLLASTDRARAVTSARDYLRRHPNGSARAEAEALAASTP